jgi:acyl carrier protein
MIMQTDSQTARWVVPQRADILRDVQEIVAEHLGMQVERLREGHALIEDLGCDSLDIVEISMELEEHFDISIPDEFGEQMRTICHVTDGVLRLVEVSRSQ